MKTEEILRYQAMYATARKAFGNALLVFEVPNRAASDHGCPLPGTVDPSTAHPAGSPEDDHRRDGADREG